MKTLIYLPLSLLMLILCILTGCERENTPQTNTTIVAQMDTWLPLKIGETTLEAQIVLTQSEQQRGLMFRTELGKNQGMLFPYPHPQRLSFWMKNTLIPLDIGFFDAKGVLVEIHKMYPKDTRSVPSTSDRIQYALEMNQGWFLQNKIYPGAQLDPALLTDALRRRGADLIRYPLE